METSQKELMTAIQVLRKDIEAAQKQLDRLNGQLVSQTRTIEDGEENLLPDFVTRKIEV